MDSTSSPSMILIETNLPDVASAERLAGDVLGARLVGCANWWPIRSSYWWDGEIVTTGEVRLVLKTDAAHQADALVWLNAHHPYDAPWIVSRATEPIDAAYTAWLQGSLA